ncbi:hemicentin, putative, partial [Ixodes scapularis]
TAEYPLHLIGVSAKDAGLYVCRASNEVGVTNSTTSVRIRVAPRVQLNPDTVTFGSGDHFEVACTASGAPAPRVWWAVPAELRSRIEPQGQRLVVHSARAGDEFEEVYCVAANQAGRDTGRISLKYLAPPAMDMVQRSYEPLEGSQVSLMCPVHAEPPSEVTWYKDGRRIDPGSEHRIVFREDRLYIQAVHTRDTGIYKCTATSAVGESSAEFNLNVLAPPAFKNEVTDATLRVVENVSLSFDCAVFGNPKPEITWFKDNRAILKTNKLDAFVSSEEQTLKIASTRMLHDGVYTCIANNKVGRVEAGVLISFLVPPAIHGSVDEKIRAVEGQDVTLECQASGVPIPDLAFFRKGRLVESLGLGGGRRELRIPAVKTSDAGFYVCRASNEADITEKKFHLDVRAPPAFEDGGSDISSGAIREVLLDSPFTLRCPVDGNPTPEVTWFKDDIELTPRGDRSIDITHHGQRLNVPHATEENTGLYTCKANNELGEILRHYNLQVRVPPYTSPGISDYQTLTPLEGGSLSLSCNISGNPVPAITWLKDGLPLTPFEFPNIQFLDSGRLLNISSLEVTHSGKYMCIATSKVGSADMTFLVDVLAPAFIDGSLQDRHQTTMLHQPVTFGCPATGSPPPGIAWFHDGVPVLPSHQGVLMFQEGRLLTLQAVLPSSAGIYTCEASNVIGHASLDYILEVLVPPIIRRKNLTSEFWVVEGSTVLLQCPADGRPPPTIVWLRGAEVLSPESDSRVTISEEDHSLTLKGVRLGDRKFTCLAGNEAGTAEQDYRVHVMVLPRLEPSVSLTRLVSAVVNRQTTLRCPVVGVPPPALHWLKEGRLLRPKGDPFVQTSADGRRLLLRRVRLRDGGNYTCVAVNEAGKLEQSYVVDVQVPPRIAGPNIVKIEVVENRAFAMECHVESLPRAAVYWTRNGLPYESDNLAEGAATPHGSRRLWFPSVRASDRGNYVCVAENEAGLAEKTFQVEVNVPPSIHVPEKAISVSESTPTKLRCQVSGIPSPSIFWMHEDDMLYDNNTKDIGFAENGQIVQIPNAKLEHSGKYTCVATNAAGSAEEQVTLSVLVPPRISKGASPPPVMLQHPATLECQVEAHPTARIEWTKDGELLESQPLVRALDGGRVLQLVHVTEELEGAYMCRAANAAGVDDHTLFLSVLDPPKIAGSNDTTTEELAVPLGETLTLPCDSTGDPPPLVSWIRDGTRLSSTDPFVRFSGDNPSSHLVLKRVRLEDAGRYICVVTNSAGVAEKHFTVTVTVPASIVKPKVMAEVNVVSGERATLECSVRGLPKPTVLWFKDGLPILGTERQDARYTFLLGGETLLVQSSGASDSGSYKCEASNPDGSDELVYKLRVVEPPDFGSRLGVTEVSMVRQGDATVIECPFLADERFPTSTRWQWNGKSLAEDLLPPNLALSLNARSIHVVRAQQDNAGRYTCTASNVAGEAHFTTLLEVLIPPSFDTISKDKISVLEGGSISLECKTHGFPDPVVSWIRDGNKILVDNPILALFNVNQSDAGTYSCEALNEAGAAQVDFILDVLEPPWFDMSAGRLELTVLEGEEVILNCPYRGKPEPRTSWYKEGRRVHPGPSVKISNDSLTIAFARSHDSGTYVCAAISEAGTAEVNLTLTVYVAPKIHQIESSPIKAIDGHPVRLSCEASGVPAPSIKWLRSNGSSAAETSSGRATTEGGFFLDFSDGVQMEDRGRYICMAENEAGVEQEEVFLDVIAPPSINQSDWSGVDILAISGQNTSLRCPAIGSPPPEIEWLRDGRSVQRADAAAVDGAHGEVLKILSVRVEDAGEYLCLARNEGGTVDMKYRLEIVEPPRIFGSQLPMLITSVVGEPTVFECPARGFPLPSISWAKESVALDSAPKNGTLLIEETQTSDAGTYACTATNSAGIASQEFVLTVHVPPKIRDLPGTMDVVSGKPLVLECVSDGFPRPNLTWHGPVIAEAVHEHGLLRIANIGKEHAGNYTCTAASEAGTDFKTTVLNVLTAPTIQKSSEDVVVVAGQPAILWCNTSGDPAPQVTWHKDNRHLQDDSDAFEILPNAVYIYTANVSDSGQYVCTVQNHVGSSQAVRNLDVLDPPTITVFYPEERTVVQGSEVSLVCQARGHPKPTVYWEHNGNLISNQEARYIFVTGGELKIPVAEVKEAGEYRCTAKNQAGWDTRTTTVTVHVPPTILKEGQEEELTIQRGGQAVLRCKADGFPLPTILWTREGDPISNPRARTEASGDLIIDSAELDDSGSYVCVATNAAGVHHRVVSLAVLVPPSISRLPRDQEVAIGQPLELSCQAHGSPAPTITWTVNDTAVTEETSEGVSVLALDSVSQLDQGTYVCVAANDVGQHKASADVKVRAPPRILEAPAAQETHEGHRAMLHCVAQGDPPPKIFWLKDGHQVLTVNSHVQQFPNGSILISPTKANDTGEYRCLATNKFGVSEAGAVVTILTPPSFTIKPQDTLVEKGSTLVLDCSARGIPPPEQSWSKLGHVTILASNRVTLLTNGTLRIHMVNEADEGLYQCKSRSKAGVATANVQVKVKDIDECEEDDVNCGRNHICFNSRGSYQCMYAPCPDNYVRDTEGSSCRLSCGDEAACEPRAHFADVLTFKTVALPSGVTAGRDVVRLSARDHDSALLAHTLFTVLSNKRNVPFDVRVSKGVGIVFATEDLPAGFQYRITLHATTRDDANKTALFETRFFLFVSTSLYPY